jgi:hypothetical protein
VKYSCQVKSLMAKKSRMLGRARLMSRKGPREVQTEICWTKLHEKLLLGSARMWEDVVAIVWVKEVDGC